MRFITLTFLILLLGTQLTFAQYIQRSVIGNAGQSSSVDNKRISWTIGETSVKSLSDSGVKLTQGFQQSEEAYTCPTGTTVFVTNTNDSGQGSLRAAIECANADVLLDTILFDISGGGVHVIEVVTELPNIDDDSIVIDGTSLTGWKPGSIIIDGSQLTGFSDGMSIWGDHVELYGLYFKEFQKGINLYFTDGCQIGDVGKGNITTGNASTTGSGIVYFNVTNCHIRGNTVGIDPEGNLIGNYNSGIAPGNDGGINLVIDSNVVGGIINQFWSSGIAVEGNNIVVSNNIIGTDTSETKSYQNNFGITIAFPTTNVTIENNVITNSLMDGINLWDNAQQIRITNNSIYCNDDKGIEIADLGNNSINPPSIQEVSSTIIIGTSSPFELIEIFQTNNIDCSTFPCQGKTYLGTTTADANGNWTLSAPFGTTVNVGDQITATATDSNNNTSEFSNCQIVQPPNCDTFADSLELVKFHDAINPNGNWTNNWLTQGLGINNWDGITTNADGCVISIVLSDLNIDGALVDLNLPHLEVLSITRSNLVGQLPSFSQLPNLRELNLGNNNINGVVENFPNLPFLEIMDIDSNNLEGNLPQFDSLPNLTYLDFNTNQLSGTFPDYSHLDKVYWMDFTTNSLGGNLPNFSMPALTFLGLGFNQFEGDLPNWSGMPLLESIFINNNDLLGSFPNLDSLASLSTLVFEENKFTFDGLEYQVNKGYQSLSYSPQDSIFTNLTSANSVGDNLDIDILIDENVVDNFYDWYQDDQFVFTLPNNNLILNDIQVSDAGIYTCLITNPNVPGLTLFYGSIEVEVIAPCNGLNVGITGTDSSCGLADGSATANVTGGVGNETYSWSNGETTQTIMNLEPGPYSVTVTDSNDCSVTEMIFITAPPPMVLSKSIVDLDCAGNILGEIDIEISGGTPGYFYNWNNGETTEDLTGLGPGTYILTLTDNNNCSVVDTTVFEGPSITLPNDTTICQGNTLTLQAGNFQTYQWNTGSSGGSILVDMEGTYSVTVTDDKGCTDSDEITISISPEIQTNLEEFICLGDSFEVGDSIFTKSGMYQIPFTGVGECDSLVNLDLTVIDLEIDLGNDTIICDTEEVTLDATNPNCQNCTYEWDDGSTNPIRMDVPSQNTVYWVILTDERGCTFTDSIQVFVQKPVVSLGSDKTICEGDSETLNAGDGWNTYLWNTGEMTQTIDITDSGIYSVTVTDNLDCLATDEVEISQSVVEANTELKHISCFGDSDGEIIVHATEGLSPFEYSLDGISYQSDSVFSNLNAQIYTVFVRDAYQCEDTIEVEILEPQELVLVLSQTLENCEGKNENEALAKVSGGTLPYQYLWSDGQIVNDSIAISLPSGNVFVTITDANNCEISGAILIEEKPNSTGFFSGPICESDFIEIDDEIFDVNNPTGTVILEGEAFNGCDSIVEVDLSFLPNAFSAINERLCPDEFIEVGGVIFDINNPIGTVVLDNQAMNGCDVIVDVELDFIFPDTQNFEAIICEGKTYEFNGEIFDQGGQYTDTLKSFSGCDSLYQILDLMIEEASTLEAEDDEYVFSVDSIKMHLKVTENDFLGGDWILDYISEPTESGDIEILNNETILFTLTNEGFGGTDGFEYVLCAENCPEICDTALVQITFEGTCIAKLRENLSSAFSPNNDGINDLFDPLVFDGQETCFVDKTGISITIVNRWGEVVFKPNEYEPWTGLKPSGNAYPQGTYYVVLEFPRDGDIVEVKGPVTLVH